MELIHIGPNKYFNDNEILKNDEINNNSVKTSEKNNKLNLDLTKKLEEYKNYFQNHYDEL